MRGLWTTPITSSARSKQGGSRNFLRHFRTFWDKDVKRREKARFKARTVNRVPKQTARRGAQKKHATEPNAKRHLSVSQAEKLCCIAVFRAETVLNFFVFFDNLLKTLY